MATSNIVVPLKPQAVSTTTSTTLATGTIRSYNATTSALAPVLPSLANVVDDDYLIVEKDSLDVSTNAVTVICAGSDTLLSGVTTVPLLVSGERVELQAATVNSLRVWNVKHHTTPRSAFDRRYAFVPSALEGVTLYAYEHFYNASDAYNSSAGAAGRWISRIADRARMTLVTRATNGITMETNARNALLGAYAWSRMRAIS